MRTSNMPFGWAYPPTQPVRYQFVPVVDLIVNADDLGRSAAINRAIMRAHDHGIVTIALCPLIELPRLSSLLARLST